MAYGACSDPEAQYPARHTYLIGGDGMIEQAIDTEDPEGQAAAILDSIA